MSSTSGVRSDHFDRKNPVRVNSLCRYENMHSSVSSINIREKYQKEENGTSPPSNDNRRIIFVDNESDREIRSERNKLRCMKTRQKFWKGLFH
mmetsp:Transcript_51732/g.62324  ORF Transcript_51732/g.62324 Transcript_51732/m.62324 type:complete len:93 (+) Transcript_51732:1051-1329(+)